MAYRQNHWMSLLLSDMRLRIYFVFIVIPLGTNVFYKTEMRLPI